MICWDLSWRGLVLFLVARSAIFLLGFSWVNTFSRFNISFRLGFSSKTLITKNPLQAFFQPVTWIYVHILCMVQKIFQRYAKPNLPTLEVWKVWKESFPAWNFPSHAFQMRMRSVQKSCGWPGIPGVPWSLCIFASNIHPWRLTAGTQFSGGLVQIIFLSSKWVMDFLVPCENLPGCMLLGGLLSSANGLGGDSNPKPPGPKPLIFHRKGVFFLSFTHF